MTKTRTGNSFLSVLLTLCMVLGLLPTMGLTAGAAAGMDADTNVLTIDSVTAAGDGTAGWKWDGSVLTLSGVSLTQLIISVPATIVLEGANKIEGGSTSALLNAEGET